MFPSHDPGGSNHNVYPSVAVDVVPYPEQYSDVKAFEDFAKLVKEVAELLNIKVRWGGDFKTFKDYAHWELV